MAKKKNPTTPGSKIARYQRELNIDAHWEDQGLSRARNASRSGSYTMNNSPASSSPVRPKTAGPPAPRKRKKVDEPSPNAEMDESHSDSLGSTEQSSPNKRRKTAKARQSITESAASRFSPDELRLVKNLELPVHCDFIKAIEKDQLDTFLAKYLKNPLVIFLDINKDFNQNDVEEFVAKCLEELPAAKQNYKIVETKLEVAYPHCFVDVGSRKLAFDFVRAFQADRARRRHEEQQSSQRGKHDPKVLVNLSGVEPRVLLPCFFERDIVSKRDNETREMTYVVDPRYLWTALKLKEKLGGMITPPMLAYSQDEDMGIYEDETNEQGRDLGVNREVELVQPGHWN